MGWFFAFWLLFSRDRRITVETVEQRDRRRKDEAEFLATILPWVFVAMVIMSLAMLPTFLRSLDACEQQGGAPPFRALTQLVAGC